MLLYLMRHGVAQNDGPTDFERPLTQGGADVLRLCAAALRKQGVRWERTLCSPLVRARQTAEILCSEMALAPARIAEALRCGASGATYLQCALESDFGVTSILLVGHMPDVSLALAYACLVRPDNVGFAPGEMACIDMPSGLVKRSGTLLWKRSSDAVVAAA